MEYVKYDFSIWNSWSLARQAGPYGEHKLELNLISLQFVFRLWLTDLFNCCLYDGMNPIYKKYVLIIRSIQYFSITHFPCFAFSQNIDIRERGKSLTVDELPNLNGKPNPFFAQRNSK